MKDNLARVVLRILSAVCRGTLTTVVGLGVASACSSEIGVEDTVPAHPGIVMPDGGGDPIDESAACERLTDALAAVETKLNCAGKARACPDYIRPAGSQACLQYDDATVAACERVIASYKSCSEIDSRRCIVSAIPGSKSPGCVPPDAGSDAEPDAEPDAGEDGGSQDAGDADVSSTDASDARDAGTSDTGPRDGAADSGDSSG